MPAKRKPVRTPPPPKRARTFAELDGRKRFQKERKRRGKIRAAVRERSKAKREKAEKTAKEEKEKKIRDIEALRLLLHPIKQKEDQTEETPEEQAPIAETVMDYRRQLEMELEYKRQAIISQTGAGVDHKANVEKIRARAAIHRSNVPTGNCALTTLMLKHPEDYMRCLSYIRTGATPESVYQTQGISPPMYRRWYIKGRDDYDQKKETVHAMFWYDVSQAIAIARINMEMRLGEACPKTWLTKGPGSKDQVFYDEESGEKITVSGWHEKSAQNESPITQINVAASGVFTKKIETKESGEFRQLSGNTLTKILQGLSDLGVVTVQAEPSPERLEALEEISAENEGSEYVD